MEEAPTTNKTGVTRPSEPNHLALVSGSTRGIIDDGAHYFAGKNMADRLEASGN